MQNPQGQFPLDAVGRIRFWNRCDRCSFGCREYFVANHEKSAQNNVTMKRYSLPLAATLQR
jgi:hypothetical protein